MRVLARMISALIGAGLLASFPYDAHGADASGLWNWGWNGVDVSFPPDASVGTAASIDVDGQVGYPLYVSAPTARCRPGPGWSGQSYVETGSLPPGVNLNHEGKIDVIGGIPTERGHWIVGLRMANIQCNGSYFKDFTQQIRFHITGSGQVVQ